MPRRVGLAVALDELVELLVGGFGESHQRCLLLFSMSASRMAIGMCMSDGASGQMQRLLRRSLLRSKRWAARFRRV
jgi:hypothetical protein